MKEVKKKIKCFTRRMDFISPIIEMIMYKIENIIMMRLAKFWWWLSTLPCALPWM